MFGALPLRAGSLRDGIWNDRPYAPNYIRRKIMGRGILLWLSLDETDAPPDLVRLTFCPGTQHGFTQGISEKANRESLNRHRLLDFNT